MLPRNIGSWTSLSAIVYLASTSFSSLLGKVVVTRFFFDYPTVVLLLQNATSLFVIELLRITNVLKINPYSFERGRHAIVPSLLLCLSQWLTVGSFEGIGLPVFDSIKRFTPLFMLIFVVLYNKQMRFDKRQVLAIFVVSFLSFLTVNLDLSVDRFSLFYGLVASACQALAYVQFEQLASNFDAAELVYLHSFNSLIVYLMADIVQDEIRDSFMFMMTSAHPLFSVVFFILLVSALPLQYCTFLAIQHLGALNTQVLSNVRACVQVLIGYTFSIYMFYGVSFNFINYIGLLLVLPASYYYYMCSQTDNNSSKMPWVTKT